MFATGCFRVLRDNSGLNVLAAQARLVKRETRRIKRRKQTVRGEAAQSRARLTRIDPTLICQPAVVDSLIHSVSRGWKRSCSGGRELPRRINRLYFGTLESAAQPGELRRNSYCDTLGRTQAVFAGGDRLPRLLPEKLVTARRHSTFLQGFDRQQRQKRRPMPRKRLREAHCSAQTGVWQGHQQALQSET